MPQAAATATATATATAERARVAGDAVMEEVDLVASAAELAAADLEALVREPQSSVAAARAVVATGGGN